MIKKLSSLTKKIILGTTAILAGSGLSFIKAESNKPDYDADMLFKGKTDNNVSHVKSFIMEKAFKNPFNMNASHRSHRSHSSHRSHFSSRTDPNQNEGRNNDNQDRQRKEPSKSTKNKLVYELGSRIIDKDMSGTDVVELQEILLKKGYKVDITGKYDIKTQLAIISFQRQNNINQTGRVDVITLYYLTK